ncbi:MAG: T9SS type A sorting domain-containing protein [Bacteroidota bacterium]
MKKITYLSAFLSLAGFSSGQLCTPAFANGCFSWNTKSVEVASINWTFDEMDCSISDYTALSTVITAGNDIPMTVSAGNWCGCSVWVDFNRDDQFDDSENLYHAGNGSTEVNVFDFTVNVPQTTINGNYTMRVISSWGSDGFTPGDNGSGGCGNYQYGNFVDFAIQVTGGQFPLGVEEQISGITVQPNPANDKIVLENKGLNGTSYQLLSLDGTEAASGKITGEKHEVIVSGLKSGIYFIQLENGMGKQKFVKL